MSFCHLILKVLNTVDHTSVDSEKNANYLIFEESGLLEFEKIAVAISKTIHVSSGALPIYSQTYFKNLIFVSDQSFPDQLSTIC